MRSDPFELGAALGFDLHGDTDARTGGWASLTTRLSDAALRDRVDQIRHALTRPGQPLVDARTAAATEQFGLGARLVAAHICAVALGSPLELRTGSIRWRQDESGWLQLSFQGASGPPNPLRDSAITDLTDTVGRLYGVSDRVLWGNIGSSANSTITLLRAARPDLVNRARAIADELLADPRIDGGSLRAGPSFRRNSCCLIYRATESLCGDCVLQTSGLSRS